MSHAFVVPVFGQSPHLRECLDSLVGQTVPSPIVLSTSTPSDWLDEVAAAYDFPLFVHGPNCGIAHDWNMAMAQVDADWVTIAHQDDTYHPHFAEATLRAVSQRQGVVLAFTDYEEMTDAGPRRNTPLLRIKQGLLEFGFCGRKAVDSRFAKTMALRFGCPIPCPSVTLRRAVGVRFDESYGVNMDWAAWLWLCNKSGAFVWIRDVLMAHRIHVASETSAAIAAGRREREDERLLRQLWPGWIARMIVRSYRLAYASNKA